MVRCSLLLFLSMLLCISFTSCASLAESKPLDRQELTLCLQKNLGELRDHSSFEELIGELEKLKKNDPDDFEILSYLHLQAIEGLLRQRDVALSERDYTQALEKGQTLTLLGETLQPSQEEVLLSYLSYLSGYSEVQTLAVADRYREISEELWKRYWQNYLKTSPFRADKQMWLKGTLTLVVDQGVRMQAGVGIPTKVLGSAFLIDRQGYALTNYHVISSQVDKSYKGYSKLYARLPDAKGERLKADVVGYSKDLDVALIKVYFPVDYYFNIWEDTQDLMRIGQSVYVLGSPLGLEQTLTSGILSAHNRTLLELGEAFQLDAAVNQGNSGGPALNSKGDVLGMVFAGIPGYEGLNFAIPSSWLRLLLPHLYEKGPVHQSWLGLAICETSQSLEVIHVVRGEACEGLLKKGDRLLSLNGKSLNSIRDYQKAILMSRSLIRLEWQRGEEVLQALIWPKSRPEKALASIFPKTLPMDFLNLLLGLELQRGKRGFFSQNYRVSRVFATMLGDELAINEGDHLEVYTLKLDENKGLVDLSFLICRQIAGFLELPIGLRLPLVYPYFI